MMPYADMDEKNRELRGLLQSFLEHMEERYEVSAVTAVTDASSTQKFYVKEQYPESETLECSSVQECIGAVVSGEATATLMSPEFYYAYRNEFEDLENLTIFNTGNEIPIGFAVRKGDIDMYSFMKKGIASITETTVNEAMIAGGYVNPELSVKQFLQRHVMMVLTVIIIIFLLMGALFIFYVFSTRRALRLARSNSELSEKAYVDLLSYACGYALSEDYLSCNMLLLLHEADQRMYQEKQEIKRRKREKREHS